MHEIILNSGWDTLLFAVPFIGMLLVGFFRLDQLFAAPKSAGKALHPASGRPACGIDAEGDPLMCDADGRPWPKDNRPRWRKMTE